MAFPTGAINDQVYSSKFGTRYKYVSASNTWVKTGMELVGSVGYPGGAGYPGLTGPQGITGLQGDTGAWGITGLQGDTGIGDIQGITGSIGLTGLSTQGVTGYYGSATGIFGMTFDGNGSYLVPGLQMSVKVPITMTFDMWEVVAQETGYISTDVKKGSYSDWPGLTTLNAGDTGPYVSNGIKNQDTDFTGWGSVQVSSGQYVQVLLTGVTGVKNATVSVGYHRV
jgi:hypothetical protein